jgi:hypothetical protein
MSAQANNNSRTRNRKYDTYIPRSGSVRGSTNSVPYSVITHKEISQSKTVDICMQPNQTVNTQRIKSPQSYSSSSNTLHSPIAAVQGSTKQIALHAVKQSDYNGLETTETNSVYVSARRKSSVLQKMMYAFASLVVVFSGVVSVQTFITNNQAQEQIATLGDAISRDSQGISEGTGKDPSEEPIPQNVVANYQVSNPEDPRFLRIPSIGVFARIKNLGVTPEGAVDAPRNIYDTGWYNGSARPGSSVGSSLILGHVSGWTGPGVFKKINELPVGGEFEIEKGSGEILKYSIVRSEQIPVDQIDMSKVLSNEEAGKHDLKLMTCSGRYNSSTETFEDRFIVYAKQI